ncbi:MAG: L,D-transpeptidase family protein [Bacillota bacterium]|nr:L,D-transpeptidase family protein [Bacillota bacterium]
MRNPLLKAGLITLAMALCLAFAGCGASEEPSQPSGSSESQTDTEQAAAFDLAAAEDSPEFVGDLEQAEDADQLFVVAATGGTTAYVSMHQKDEDGTWKQIMTTPGYIGLNGLGKTKEGDLKTPVGTFHFNYAFGINEDPGCEAFAYQQVTEDDYWSGDQRDGYHYNEMVSIKDLPDLNVEASERIVDYPVHYQYCLNISYNEEGEAGKGSAIFLHCLGPQKPYTGGCVAIPKDQIITVLQNVDEDCVVVIDSLENLSPELWEEWGL